MTVNSFEDDTDEDAGTDRRKLIAGGAVGALALVAVGVLVLSGGGSSSSTENAAIPRGHPKGGLASPTAAPSSPEAAIATTNVASTDPFQVPTRILQALAPPPAATTAAPTVAGTTTAGTPTGTVGSPGTTPTGTTGTTTGTGKTPSGPKTAASSVQFVQLLGAKKTAHGWTVTVRTNHGTCTGIKEGALKVCGTDFSFTGEDELTGKQTFIFVFGEVQGGNLIPNAAQKPKPVKAGFSALVAVNGKVDGGITAGA
jgi:hypothetical protein